MPLSSNSATTVAGRIDPGMFGEEHSLLVQPFASFFNYLLRWINFIHVGCLTQYKLFLSVSSQSVSFQVRLLSPHFELI